MSWTRVEIELDVDGERESVYGDAIGDLLSLLLDDERVIAVSGRVGWQHVDDCDGSGTCACVQEDSL